MCFWEKEVLLFLSSLSACASDLLRGWVSPELDENSILTLAPF